MKDSKSALRELGRILLIIAASTLNAFALNLFLVGNNIAAGGFSGMSTVIHYVNGWPIGLMTLAMNIPVYILSYKNMGRRFFFSCLFATVVMSLSIDLLAFLPTFTDDRLMAAIYGGLLFGLSVGLMYHAGASNGGTELLSRLLAKWLPFLSVGGWMTVIDGFVVACAAFVYGEIESALYAAIVIYITSKVTDAIISGLDYAKVCYIITNKTDKISAALFSSSPRGITRIEGTGLYTGSEHDVLMTVIKKSQLISFKNTVRETDPEAFVIVSEAVEVLGRGFKKIETTPDKL